MLNFKNLINYKNFICLPAWSQQLAHYLNHWIYILHSSQEKFALDYHIWGRLKIEKGCIYSYIDYAIACSWVTGGIVL